MPLCALKPSNLKYLKHSALLMHSPRRPPGCNPASSPYASENPPPVPAAAPSRAFHLAPRRKLQAAKLPFSVLHDPASENSGNFGGRSPYGLYR